MTIISAVATDINRIAHSFEFGKLQEIRKRLKGMKRAPAVIFDVAKLSVNDEKGWAFHTGGREELQFNIGIEKKEDRFRFGVAFSLETSRSMTDISTFLPKIDRFNDYVRRNARELDSYRMWIWRGAEIIVPDTAVRSIIENEVKVGNFIFLEKSAPTEPIDISEIGRTFDELIPLYCFVETMSDNSNFPVTSLLDFPFAFREGVTIGNASTSRGGTPGLINVDLQSNQIKARLCDELRKGTPTIKLGAEIPSGNGGRIDLVSCSSTGKYDFYEIKPALLARHAIREALPQLLEYAYRRGGMEAQRLVIVSQAVLDSDSHDFLAALRSKGLPIHYHQISLD